MAWPETERGSKTWAVRDRDRDKGKETEVLRRAEGLQEGTTKAA